MGRNFDRANGLFIRDPLPTLQCFDSYRRSAPGAIALHGVASAISCADLIPRHTRENAKVRHRLSGWISKSKFLMVSPSNHEADRLAGHPSSFDGFRMRREEGVLLTGQQQGQRSSWWASRTARATNPPPVEIAGAFGLSCGPLHQGLPVGRSQAVRQRALVPSSQVRSLAPQPTSLCNFGLCR